MFVEVARPEKEQLPANTRYLSSINQDFIVNNLFGVTFADNQPCEIDRVKLMLCAPNSVQFLRADSTTKPEKKTQSTKVKLLVLTVFENVPIVVNNRYLIEYKFKGGVAISSPDNLDVQAVEKHSMRKVLKSAIEQIRHN